MPFDGDPLGEHDGLYHPQTDGLVERYNRTLIDMLAQSVGRSGRDWDVRLFAYRASLQESTVFV